MLSQFTLDFEPTKLSNKELVAQITKITPHILTLPQEEQIMMWEFIGTNLKPEQQDLVNLAVSNLFTKESHKQNYAQGISFISYDIAQLNQSIETLKNIENPDKFLTSAISSMEELQTELNKKYKKNKIKVN